QGQRPKRGPTPSAEYTELPLENIASPHVSDSHAPPSIQKSGAQDKSFNENKGGRKDEFQNIAAPAAGPRCLCSQCGIAVDPCCVVVPVAVGKVKKIAGESVDHAVDADPLVDEVALPSAVSFVIEADLPIGIPARMIDPTPHV